MTLRVKNSLNATAFEKVGETFTMPSKTVPDQAMSVREILRRYSLGLSVGGGRVPIYEGEEDAMPDLSKMDLADRQSFMEAAANEIEETRLRHERYLKHKQTKEDEAYWEKKIATRFKQQNTPEAAILTERSETLNKP